MSLGDFLKDQVVNHLTNKDDDFSSAASHAQHHSSSQDASLFNTAVSFLNSRKSNLSSDDIDESELIGSHQRLYSSSGDQPHDSNSLGAGAAMQALKMFSSGEAGSESAGHDQNKFIALAMAQAEKLWEQKNSEGAVSEDKQTAVNKAAEMAFKMYMKSQASGSSGTGGPGGLMSLASKFM
ncbi:hypothetical protein BDV59DRAFT_28589 [Aspergillus ambiguus]|uniref:uncharacterized protein n=1 Tax=Aspergillus ambiguus TaxID=176160 RepID=UPI003CCE3962